MDHRELDKLIPKGRGRPTAYQPEFCEDVIALGRAGKSKAQIASKLDVHRETLNEWAKAHPEFSDAIKRAQLHALAWWENKGQKGISKGSMFNATAYIFQMHNRFRDDYVRNVETVQKADVGEAFIAHLRNRVSPQRPKPDLHVMNGGKKP